MENIDIGFAQNTIIDQSIDLRDTFLVVLEQNGKMVYF